MPTVFFYLQDIKSLPLSLMFGHTIILHNEYNYNTYKQERLTNCTN